MHRSSTSTSSARGRYRLGAGFALIVGLFGAFLAFAPSAFAHHPTVTATTACNDAGAGYDVNFSAVSWQQSGGINGGGANPHIDVYYRTGTGGNAATGWQLLTWQAGYFYGPSNNYAFADTFNVADLTNGNQVQVEVRAAAIWGDGKGGGETWDSDWQTFPTNCQTPGTGTVSATPSCTGANGTVVVTLSNTGGANAQPVHFVVTNPIDQSTTVKDVAPGASATVTLTGLADGGLTIPVTADGVHHDQTVTIKCDVPGTPDVTSSVACANGNGDVTITLSNTGGNQPITFVITDPRTKVTTTKVVGVNASTQVVLSGFPDAPVTVPVTADGKSYDQALTITCDRPGLPSVATTLACTNGDGDVTLTLSNTGGDLPVVFVVADPRTNAPTTKTVAVGATATVVLHGFADGTVTIPVTADGTAANQTVTVHCDVPGVPSVSAGSACVEVSGVVTITLANTGGNQPITFVVTDPRTNTPTTKVVAPGTNTSVVLSGFADGKYTIPVTADGANIDQAVTVKCHTPGVGGAKATMTCVNFDGDVAIALTNTGGTDAVHFVVSDPRGGAPIVKNVAVGDSATVTLTAFADGTYTIGITADGKAINQTIKVDCDRPGVPSVFHDVECAETGGVTVVTLQNFSQPGEAEAIVFVVTDPRTGASSTVTLAPGATSTVTLDHLADGTYTIPLTADGKPLEAITVTIDCQNPEVTAITTSCEEGGQIVKLSNTGGSPVEVTVTSNGTEVKTLVIPAKGTNSVLVPMTNGQTATIEVRQGTTVISTETVTHTCEEPTTTTSSTVPGESTTTTSTVPGESTTTTSTVPGESTTTTSTTTPPGVSTNTETPAPEVSVLADTVTKPATTTGSLPVTGSSTFGMLLLGGALLLGGLCLIQATRATKR